jgi:hypothetical protein
MVGSNPRVVIAFGKQLRKSAFSPDRDASWIYLGKDVEAIERVEAWLGASRRYPLGGKLHQVAEQMRRPFLDFVSEVGILQGDRVAWWSTAFSWKSWVVSELFLLLCYLRIARELAEEAVQKERQLVVVVEDAWVFSQMTEFCSGNDAVQVVGEASLFMEKVRAIAFCFIKRTWWLMRTLRNYCVQRWLWGLKSVDLPKDDAAAIYSYPLERCLKEKNGWRDPFLPDVDALLKAAGYQVKRFSPPEAHGLEREIAERHEYFQPLILYATASGILRSLLAFWWPRWPQRLEVAGTPIHYLAEREWWLDIARSAWCAYRMFYECLAEMLQYGKWRLIVYPFENQPWEKMISICASKTGVRTVGIQHALFSKYSMSYFLGAGESTRMPLPDVICASGPYPSKTLVEGGIPENRISMAGSIRYGYLGGDGLGNQLEPALVSNILVALPVDIHQARHLLKALRDAFPMGGAQEGLRFYVKAHPMCPIREGDIGFHAFRAPDDFRQALEISGLVIFIGSTTGPEALAMGRQVLRYQPEMLLNVDPSEAYGDFIPTCTEANMRQAVLSLIHNPVAQCSREAVQACTRKVFGLLDRNIIEEIFAPASNMAQYRIAIGNHENARSTF